MLGRRSLASRIFACEQEATASELSIGKQQLLLFFVSETQKSPFVGVETGSPIP